MSWRVGAVLGLSCVASGELLAQDGGLHFFTGETLFEGGSHFSVAHRFERRRELYDGSRDVSDPGDREFSEHRYALGFTRGVQHNFSVSALLPIVEKQFEQRIGGRTVRSETFGIGDLALLAKRNLHKSTWPRGAITYAVIGGIEVPTGRTNFDEGGQRLPTALQPGSGSWDPFGSFAATFEHDRWRADARVFAKWNTKGAQDFDDSDVLTTEISGAYRFVHERYPGPSHNLRLGLLHRVYGKARLGGDVMDNTGRRELLARVVLTLHPRPRYDIILAVDAPLWQRVRGQQLGLDLRTFIAFGLRF